MKENNIPEISVVMSVYNRSNTLKESVRSILTQTLENFEFIICDDCSTDNSYISLLELQKEDNRIIVIRNETNIGLAASLNKCINLARGAYIARMDDDDISHKERFQLQYDFLTHHPEYSIVGCRCNTFDNKGLWAIFEHYGSLSSRDIMSGRMFVHPSVMIRKSDFIKAGGYTVSKRTMRGQDFDLWCKMYSSGFKGYILENILFDYYEDRDSLKVAKFKTRYYNFLTRKKWRSKLNLPLKYDIYAWKEILAGILPAKILVLYKQLRNKR